MSMTVGQARDEISKLFSDGWKAAYPSAPIQFDDRAGAPSGSPLWARLTIRHQGGTQSNLMGAGNVRRWDRFGIVTVQVFATANDGLTISDAAVNVVERIFRGKVTPSDIWFQNVRINEVGRDGAWWQTNVLAEFTYDEIS